MPSLTYIAEVYWDREWDLQQQGFHFTYDKRLLDRLQRVQPAEVRAHLHADPAYANRLVRFLENHDEPRSAPAFAGRLPAAATIALSLPGMRFLFEGQLEGSEIRTPVQLGRWPAESPVPAIRGSVRPLASLDRSGSVPPRQLAVAGYSQRRRRQLRGSGRV